MTVYTSGEPLIIETYFFDVNHVGNICETDRVTVIVCMVERFCLLKA